MEKYMLPCFFKMITGMDCPGCGFQRSLWALMKGDFAGSFNIYPPLGVILISIVILAVHVKYPFRYSLQILIVSLSAMVGSILINFICKLV